MESRKLLPNASYYAFTATPKNKTLEIFGDPDPQSDGTVRHEPFHTYSMKQAVQEGFILDVLKHYTPVNSYYKLAKKVEDDPEFDVKKGSQEAPALRGGARARDPAQGRDHGRPLSRAGDRPAQDRRQRAGDGGHERGRARDPVLPRHPRLPEGAKEPLPGDRRVLGGARLRRGEGEREHAERVPVVQDRREGSRRIRTASSSVRTKFQTGYDEPLLHTMYVDKTLSGIKAVQTLSRLNRAHPKKHDVFVLDFLNDTETITEAFSTYYRTTVLADETDPNKLHDLQADLDGAQVYAPDQLREFVKRYLDGVERERLDPILDRCVAVYVNELGEDEQVAFKSKAKGFVRTYAFLSSLLTYNNQDWEERSIFLNFLIPKLPSPVEEDLSKGILETIDMDSYRVEKRAMREIMLEDEDAEIEPVPGPGGAGKGEPEIDRLSAIIEQFNDLFGSIDWQHADRVSEMITETIPAKVAEDTAFKNARENSDRENARIEHDRALARVMTSIMKDDTELFKQFVDNTDFKRWLGDTVFRLAYEGGHTPQVR